MGDLAVDVALQVRVRHAEGPMWDAPTARLWWGRHREQAGALLRSGLGRR